VFDIYMNTSPSQMFTIIFLCAEATFLFYTGGKKPWRMLCCNCESFFLRKKIAPVSLASLFYILFTDAR